MKLKHLSVTNFKNIAEASLDFSDNVNCFLGDNGMGKSNLLDALYFMSFCRSFSGAPDSLLITGGETFAIVKGEYERMGADEDIAASLSSTGRRKSFRRSGKEYQRLSDHIGLLPLVMVSPADSELIAGSAETRRRFIDMVISQADRVYLDALIRYNRTLTQRNAMLRDGIVDPNLYAAVDMQLDGAADYITRRRGEWISRLSDIFGRYYAAISPGDERPELAYDSSLAGRSFIEAAEQNRRRDEIVRHTGAGPHRDDIAMTLDGMPARTTASQGQAKTYTIALRLAQYEFLKQSMEMSPMLLLDDIFDKLDAKRVERIMAIAASPTFGQIFITDTNRKHLDEIVGVTDGDYRLWNVERGTFTPIES
ncbi:MAG: DNA replication/repair protein RecF [Muribaculaceae bacterium]